MMPIEVKELLRNQAEQVHLHGDFASSAISGAHRVRARRAVTAAVAGVLAVAIPFGLTRQDAGPDRGAPATSSMATTPAEVPTRVAVKATARSGAPAGPTPVPYVQQGLLHLGGRAIRVSDPGRHVLFFGTLSNGGVVYQTAGPNPDLPNLDAGPVTFLDSTGRSIREHELVDADVDGLGDTVTGVDTSGVHVAFDVEGLLLGRFVTPDLVSPFPSGLASLVGERVAVSLVGGEPYLWLGDIDTGRSFALQDESGRMGGALQRDLYFGLAVHEGRSLVVQGKRTAGGYECKVLVDFRSGERLREWCDPERAPAGFSPAGDWMYGTYPNAQGVWVERADDGAPLLEVRSDTAAGDELAGALTPSPNGEAILVSVTAKDGTTVITSCALSSGKCTVLGDGRPGTGEVTLPMNLGR
jgi:hypothetical protein